MFPNDPSFEFRPCRPFDQPQADGLFLRTTRPQPGAPAQTSLARPVVDISPPDTIKRRMATGRSLSVEIVQSTRSGRIEHRFCAPFHLLVVCEQGARQDGETDLADLPRSTLRNLTRKLTFVPAGHRYHEWHEPRTPMRLIYFYLEPSAFQALAGAGPGDVVLHPRLFFEDRTLWDSALKLKRLVENPAPEDRLYFDALGVVLVHELVRLNHGTHRREPMIRGGLATWQQRLVTAYIEEHLSEPIPILMLARLCRLSLHYFCRAFKQSFGLPPHRYHGMRRIERAKVLLSGSALSVTEIGLKLGFSETSSFSTAFRKWTGQTPTAFYRSLG